MIAQGLTPRFLLEMVAHEAGRYLRERACRFLDGFAYAWDAGAKQMDTDSIATELGGRLAVALVSLLDSNRQ